jgi:hypothetical protein
VGNRSCGTWNTNGLIESYVLDSDVFYSLYCFFSPFYLLLFFLFFLPGLCAYLHFICRLSHLLV